MRILLTVVILDSNVFTGAIDKKNIQYFGKGQEIPWKNSNKKFNDCLF